MGAHVVDDGVPGWDRGRAAQRRARRVRAPRGDAAGLINYRFAAHDGHWSYRLDTLNLAHGEVAANTFLGTPTRVVDERSGLR